MNKAKTSGVKRVVPAEAGADVSDEWLFQGYLEGHETCLAMLVRRYERELFSYLRRVIGEATLAEDVFQNTFLAVHLKRHLYEEGRPFRPWLYTIATNQAIDAMRRNKRHQRPSLDAEYDGGRDQASAMRDLVASDLPDPLAQAVAGERRDLIRAAVDGLSEHLRTVVALSYYQGMKYKDIADILDIPVGTVKSRLHTAVRRLADEWERLGLAP